MLVEPQKRWTTCAWSYTRVKLRAFEIPGECVRVCVCVLSSSLVSRGPSFARLLLELIFVSGPCPATSRHCLGRLHVQHSALMSQSAWVIDFKAELNFDFSLLSTLLKISWPTPATMCVCGTVCAWKCR